MKIAVNSKITFYNEDQAFIHLENKSNVEDEKFGEILLFCCFTLRMLNNLKRDPTITELGEKLYKINPHNIKEIQPEGNFRLVNQKQRTGKNQLISNDKRFIINLKYGKEFLRFNSYARGFGFLAIPIYDYAPIAVTLLLLKLYQYRCDDEKFTSWLAKSASACGEMFLNEQVTMRNQNQLAFNATTIGAN